MIITRATNKVVEYLSEKKAVKDSFWLSKLKYLGIPIKNNFEIDNDCLILKEFNLKLNKKQAFFIEGYFDAERLVRESQGEFRNEGDRILLKIDSAEFYVNSKQEIAIFREVFLNKCYNFIFRKDSILFDIGFNVGVSTIFLGRDDFVKKIYGFEPFAKTLEYATENLNLNPSVKVKTQLYNFGLSDQNKQLKVYYSLENKGSVSTSERIIGNAAYRPNNKNNEIVSELTVELRDASIVLSEIFEKEKDYQIICKIDCEGGEFEIIDSLHQNNLLRFIDVIMMEWHFELPHQIITQLSDSNFNTIQSAEGNVHGLIYAFNDR
jgi:FkbM family methyltransferase